MNDIAATAAQLARLRESVEHKQLELDGMSSARDAERARSIQFINKLMLSCRGFDRELDNRLARLKLKLEGTHSLTELDDELLTIEKLLQQHSVSVDESMTLTRSAIEIGTKYLKGIKGFPEDTRQALREFLASPNGYGIAHHQKQVIRLLSFYQQAIKIQLLPEQPSTIEAATHQQEPSARQPAASSDDAECQLIADELQRLITELDFAGEIGDQLDYIRRQLLSGIAPAKLAPTCMRVIQLIIDGTREERTISRAFISNLNESLAAVHIRFAETLDEGRTLHDDTSTIRQAMFNELAAIDDALISQDSLSGLKEAITGHKNVIQQLLQAREEAAKRELQLINHLSTMESKLRLMKEETADYKKRLTIQKHKLFIDSLTQVHNRAALDERLELEYKRWLRYETPLCLAVIDIDHFKQINDNYGHMAGDKALKVVAKALQNNLRDTDFIARFGGEEFVVILPNINPDKYHKPLEKLRQTIKYIPFRFRDTKVEITISIGATLFKKGDSTTEVFERADQALYQAKHAGRDQVSLA